MGGVVGGGLESPNAADALKGAGTRRFLLTVGNCKL
jgi:hypothetical protein